MHDRQKEAFEQEMKIARSMYAQQNFASAFYHLECAHILGQRHVIAHVRSHWWMLRLEMRRGKRLAAAGQGVRMVLGAVGSALGQVPAGNSGGSNVSMFRRMPVPGDLQTILDNKRDEKRSGSL